MINDTENRNFLRELIESNVTKKLIPKGLGWFGCMGGLSLLAFMTQLGTGIFLMFYFIPSAREAFASIQYVTHRAPYGWLIQRMHALNDQKFQNHVFMCKYMPARVGKTALRLAQKGVMQLNGGSCCHFERVAQHDVLNPIN